MLMGESTATVTKISIGTEEEVLVTHKSAYCICKEFLGLLPKYCMTASCKLSSKTDEQPFKGFLEQSQNMKFK
jgi:hypothetical protein